MVAVLYKAVILSNSDPPEDEVNTDYQNFRLPEIQELPFSVNKEYRLPGNTHFVQIGYSKTVHI